MIAVIDYGMGNLRSVQKALESLGAETVISNDPDTVRKADKVVLPGVGAFGKAMDNLTELHLVDIIRERISAGTPFLGICLGMQLLMDSSEELGTHQGLGIFPGAVKRFPTGITVPHMGWNQVYFRNHSPYFHNIPSDAFYYFVHAYYVIPEKEEHCIAVTEYGTSFTSVVGVEHVIGCQFHPEKSQKLGLQILQNFISMS